MYFRTAHMMFLNISKQISNSADKIVNIFAHRKCKWKKKPLWGIQIPRMSLSLFSKRRDFNKVLFLFRRSLIIK